MSADLGTVVLAAGEGTRMRSALPKVLHHICGRPLVRLVLDVADALGTALTVLVLGPETVERVADTLGTGYGYTVQEDRLGTGHALLQARPLLQGKTKQVLVLYGDAPLLRPASARALCEEQHRSGALVSLLSFAPPDPTGYGRLIRDAQGHLIDLVEERNATPAQRTIGECNSGIYCFDAAWLWQQIDQIAINPLKGEYYLTDMVAMAVAQHGPGAASAILVADPDEARGVNDRAQLAEAEAVLRNRILRDLMLSGVTITDPAATYVDAGVTVGNDAVLLPGTLLQGRTSVGAGCVIGPHTRLTNATVGTGASISFSVVEHTDIPPATIVGPFTYLHN
jgi:bifunctional UDP-N-acetylglucosamine pyrophosphorylase/glucosamine-1-phosphate N-acetyltransferase